ncbi:MAG: glucose-6-phosphate isomerase [Caldilinea sp.]|nr:glucose-6-phosphate isomerase [Caldilinea sp.]
MISATELDRAETLRFDPLTGIIAGRAPTSRYLVDVGAVFADRQAYTQLVVKNPLVYEVTQVEEHNGDGQVHYGLGIIYPGKVGSEYFMTKGHLHEWRSAAEVYIGLRGRGMMLLEDERTGECRAVPLAANSTVYVPGYAAHRTVNVGDEPLVYWGILSSAAGHDYGTVGERNFRKVIVEKDGRPVVMDRDEFLRELEA